MTTATGFNAIVGQQHPIRLLKIFIRSGKVPHALLFTGDDGVGKTSTAVALAMACNCRTLASRRHRQPRIDAVDACGTCASCKKIAGNHHPDILRVAPVSSVIRIGQVRALLQTLALKPYAADRRVVIIDDAQAMNTEAANALLKVLEEPPDRTLLVLIATQTSDLMPTVVSRCRHIRFAPLDEEAIQQLLTAEDDVPPATAATVAALCDGSITRARQWVDDRWLNHREWLIGVLNDLLAHSPRPDIRNWLALSERLAKKKDRIEESLAIITMWLRDILVAGCDARHVLNRDRLDLLTTVAGQVDRAVLIDHVEAVSRARRALLANANVRLTLDAMVLQMAGICVRP